MTAEDDDVVEASLSTVEKDLRFIVGNMFEIRRNRKGKPIIRIPTRLLTGDRSQPAYKDKDLKQYVDRKGPWKNDAEREAYQERLLNVLEKVIVPIKQCIKVYLQQRFIKAAQNKDIRIYDTDELVGTFRDLFRAWAKKETDDYYKLFWEVFHGDLELDYGWDGILAALVSERCGVECVETEEELQAMRKENKKGAPKKPGMVRVVTNVKGDMVKRFMEVGRDNHGRNFRIRAPNGQRLAKHKKGEFHEQLLMLNLMRKDRIKYWAREKARKGRAQLREVESPRELEGEENRPSPRVKRNFLAMRRAINDQGVPRKKKGAKKIDEEYFPEEGEGEEVGGFTVSNTENMHSQMLGSHLFSLYNYARLSILIQPGQRIQGKFSL